MSKILTKEVVKSQCWLLINIHRCQWITLRNSEKCSRIKIYALKRHALKTEEATE